MKTKTLTFATTKPFFLANPTYPTTYKKIKALQIVILQGF